MKWIVYILCTALMIASYFFDLEPLAVSRDSAFYTHITYMFVHRGIIHFAGNMIALYLLFRACRRIGVVAPCTKSLVCAFLSSIFQTDGLTVGISGAVYAILGMVLVYNKSKDYFEGLAIAVVVNAIVAVFGGGIGWTIHLSGFIFGYIIELTWKRTILQKKNDSVLRR